ncbi:hypothetical protein ABZ470_39565 [Streptosporangium sp. NPDC020072]|uniref:hypothetical protein n=1 Tax=Streptosporangium sp. NPDC020072 TaxID=3154788 RepID=UPI0034329248
MTGIGWVDVFVVIGIVGGASALVWRGLRLAARKTRRLTHFLDDWQGEPARPGVEARPGIPERLQKIESELRRNSGTSLRDVVDRLERGLLRVEDGLATHLEQHRAAAPVVNVTNVQTGTDGEPPAEREGP